MEPKINKMMSVSSLIALIAVVALSGLPASSYEALNSTSQSQLINNSSSLLGATLKSNSQKQQTSKIKLDCSPEICVKVNKTCALTDYKTGTKFDLRKITNNTEEFLVPNFMVDKKNSTLSMVLSFCHGLNSSISCENKRSSVVSACLLEDPRGSITAERAKIKGRTKDNSRVAGFHLQARLRYFNKDLYYESFTFTETYENQTDTKSLKGTSIKFFCSDKDDNKPTFISFVNSTFNFGWGSKLMCPQNLTNYTNVTLVSDAPKLSNVSLSTNSTGLNNVTKPSTTEAKPHDFTPIPQNITAAETTPEFSDSELKINPDEAPKSAEGKHTLTVNDSTKINAFPTATENVSDNGTTIKQDKKSTLESNNISSSSILTTQPSLTKEVHASEQPAPIRMNRLHKFFMISLIIISLASFTVVIFILDNKTRLRLPLNNIRRRARQAFQPQPVPYSRVDDFNDCLDL